MKTESLGFVVYLDILGTSDSTNASNIPSDKKEKQQRKTLKEDFDEFRTLIEKWFPYSRWGNKLNIFGLSDSLFLTLEVETQDDASITVGDQERVREFFESLRDFQMDCLEIGKPVRGGIAFGEYTIDEPKTRDRIHMILGQVVVSAVKIEESMKMVGIAIVPIFATRQDHMKMYQKFIEALFAHGLLIKYSVPCEYGLVPTYIVSWKEITEASAALKREFGRSRKLEKKENPYPKMAKYIATLEALGQWNDDILTQEADSNG